jgi:hypothetical protein
MLHEGEVVEESVLEKEAVTVPFDSSREHANAAQDTEIARPGIGSES